MHFLADRKLIAILLVLAWMELSLIPALSIRMVKPDLFFVFLVFYAFRVNWHRVTVLALMLGLLKDLFSNSFFGLETASFTVAAVLLEFLAVQFDREKRLIQCLSLFAFSWVAMLVYSFLSSVVQADLAVDSHLTSTMFVAALYTTLVALALFPFLEKWVRPLLAAKQYELF
jgi:rod shape-determining protein MreD